MTPLDWIIVAFTALFAVWGYAQGLIMGALSLGGFAAGALLGSRLGPVVLEEGSRSPYAPLLALVGALMVGGILASGLEVLGFHLRRRLGPRLGRLDGLGGAALVAALGLGLAWIGGAVALQTPGARELREPIQRSAILKELNARLPPSGGILKALARFDPVPRIEGPDADVRPPDAAIARDPQVAAAGGSVVRVLGTACGLGVQGSGWIGADGVVVTNAHVVAGQDDTRVELGDEGSADAEAIWYDARNDLALLRVPELAGEPVLPLRRSTPSGTSAAILGFPENGPYDVRAARVGRTSEVVSEDAYGRGPVTRSMTAIRGLIRSGNSGGPVVDDAGRVVTTVFAASVSNDGRAGFGVPVDVVREALAQAGEPVDTGPCTR